MAEHEQPTEEARDHGASQTAQERYQLLHAQQLSRKWGERLDEFRLPCPLCRGELQFQGARPDHYYEFAEGEPGVVYALDALSLMFICNRCGYVAEFDTELFNPAYIAELEGAPPEQIEHLSIRDYRVLVSLEGDEPSKTLLDLATSLAGEEAGEVVVIDNAADANFSRRVEAMVEGYQPHKGDPAPVQIVPREGEDMSEELLRIAEEQDCDLLLLDGHEWANQRPAVTEAVNKVLATSTCDVALVYDRGVGHVRRILLATSGGSNARAAAQVAISLAGAYDAELHVLYVASPNLPNWREEGQKAITETLRDLSLRGVDVQRRVLTGADFADTIIAESCDFDMLVMGASTARPDQKARRGNVTARIARNSPATSIMVHAHQTVLESWFRRLFG